MSDTGSGIEKQMQEQEQGQGKMQKQGQRPCDPHAAESARMLLEWLAGLTGRSTRRVLVGQYISRNANNSNPYTPEAAWDRFYEGVYQETGEYPALVGFDLSQRSVDGYGDGHSPSDSNWREFALRHHAEGGLLRLMWHAGNPWTLETSWSSVPAGHSLAELYTPGNEVYDRWQGWLAELADVLHVYAQRDIPVLWGPFHEMSGEWFWWGTGDAGEFRQLWSHMYRYLTEVRGLHHLLWTFCPDVKPTLERAVSRYPGNGEVDIIAPDLYYLSPETPANPHLYEAFSDPVYGKVLGWGEIGVETKLQIDNRKFIEDIRAQFPGICMYMQWGDVLTATREQPFALTSNNGLRELARDPWAVWRSGVLKP